VKKSELDVTTATNDLAKAKSALKVLTEYQHPKDLADKKNTVSQADQKLVRTQRENAANLSQKNADVQAKQQNFSVLKRRMEHWQEQLADCTITAPADGMVVYASSGDRWSQVQIQEGATVRERQTLLRLPDTSSMKAVARINESQVGKLAEGMRARVRIASIARPIGATVTKISVLADSNSRWVNPDLKEYPVDLVLDETPKSLKPGMSSQVEILVNHLSDVLAVPLASVYAAGNDVYVFTRDGKKVKPVKVKVGQANDQYVQIRDGLASGADVLLLGAGQGRDLLEENGIKITPTTRSTDEGFGPRRGGGARNGGQRGSADGARPDGAAGPGPGGSAPAQATDGARPDGARADGARTDGSAQPNQPNGTRPDGAAQATPQADNGAPGASGAGGNGNVAPRNSDGGSNGDGQRGSGNGGGRRRSRGDGSGAPPTAQ
jgi:RND family efflux transporter MFP subunit